MGRPKITYNNIDIDFPVGAGAQNLIINKLDNIFKKRSSSGITEVINKYQDTLIKFELPYYSREFENELKELYDYCRSGNSCKLVLDQDLGFYIPFEGDSLESSDGLDATFTRASGAYWLNANDGLYDLTTDNDDERFVEGKFGRGLLIESAATNSCNNDFTNAAWNKTNVTAAASTDCKDMTGATTYLYKLTPDGVGTPSLYQDTTQAVNTNDGTFSVYLRSLEGSFDVTIRLYRKNGAATQLATTTVAITPEWQRLDINYATTGNYAGDVFRAYFQWDNDTSKIVYACLPQLTTKEHPVTFGTRSAESCYYDISSILTQHVTKWSLSFWIKPEWNHNGHTAVNKNLIFITRSAASNRHSSLICLASGNFEARVYNAVNSAYEISTTASTYLNEDEWSHIVMTCDSTQANNFKLYANGVLLATDTNNQFVPTEGGRLYLGCDPSTGDEADAVFDEICFFKNRILTATEILEHYQSSKGWGFQQNTWNNVYFNDYSWVTKFENGAPHKTCMLEFIEKLT